MSCLPFIKAFLPFDPGTFSHAAGQLLRHADEDYGEVYIVGEDAPAGHPVACTVSRRLQAVSPYSPGAAVVMIDDNWAEARGQAKELEERFAGHPEVLARLAIRYGKLGRLDDERRCLEKYNRVSPNSWSYRRIAEIHKEQGRPDLWQSTLEEFLKLPDDLGLQHATVEVELAQAFMSRGEFGKAMPYAEVGRADRGGVGVRMRGAGERGGRGVRAGRVVLPRRGRAYPNSFMQWFLFCKRTGRRGRRRGDEARGRRS